MKITLELKNKLNVDITNTKYCMFRGYRKVSKTAEIFTASLRERNSTMLLLLAYTLGCILVNCKGKFKLFYFVCTKFFQILGHKILPNLKKCLLNCF